jgi:hypothetical protein
MRFLINSQKPPKFAVFRKQPIWSDSSRKTRKNTYFKQVFLEFHDFRKNSLEDSIFEKPVFMENRPISWVNTDEKVCKKGSKWTPFFSFYTGFSRILEVPFGQKKPTFQKMSIFGRKSPQNRHFWGIFQTFGSKSSKTRYFRLNWAKNSWFRAKSGENDQICAKIRVFRAKLPLKQLICVRIPLKTA